jgi:hypothetical protein
MRCARALPTIHLMPAAGSCYPPAATPSGVDAPERMSGRALSSPHMSGTPSIIMSPDHRPWTQIRLGAGTHRVVSCTTLPHGRQHMT